MDNTVKAYNKYKSQVLGLINPKDMDDSQKKFDALITSLSEQDKGASDMLRSLYSSEAMKIAIDKLKEDKKKIEEQINIRLKELQEIQQKLK